MAQLRPIAWTALAAALLLAQPARAIFHFWEIAEIYSNADGSVQYIEFFTSSGGQGVLDAHELRATSDGVIRTLTFDRDLVGDTANARFLVATPGFAALPGAVAPDFVLPCGPFFDPAAASITIDFVGADTLVFAGARRRLLRRTGDVQRRDLSKRGRSVQSGDPDLQRGRRRLRLDPGARRTRGGRGAARARGDRAAAAPRSPILGRAPR